MADITGNIFGTTSNPDIQSGIAWEETVNPVTNTGVVTARLFLRTFTGYKTYSNDSDFSLTVNGVTASHNNHYFEVGPGTGWTEVAFFNAVSVPHNADGTKSIVISATGRMSGTSMTSISCSGTAVLYAIPRASAILSPLPTTSISVDGVNSVSVLLDRKVSTYTHTVRLYVGSSYATATYKQEFTGVGTNVGWLIPTSWRLAMPTTTSATVKIDVLTFSGATQIGSTVNGTFTITVPASIVPSVGAGNVTLAPVQAAAISGFDTYVQGYSRVGATFSPTGWDSYEAAITGYYIQIGGVKTETSPYQTAIINTSGTVPVTVGVTDARERTGTYTTNITVYPYSKPSFSVAAAFRCDALGAASESGGYISSTQTALFSSCGGENSIVYLHGRYKSTTSETYGSWETLTNGATTLVGGALTSTASYDYQLYVEDETGPDNAAAISFVIPTALVPFNIKAGNNGVAFGKYAETNDLLESAWDFEAPNIEATTNVTAGGVLTGNSLVLTTPLGFTYGGLGSNSEASARTALKTNIQTFTSVTQLGLTAGVPTLNEVFAAMPNNSDLKCLNSDLAAAESPALYGTIYVHKSLYPGWSYAHFSGRNSTYKDYRKYLVSPYTSFDSTWILQYDAASTTQIASDLGVTITETTTPATTPTLSASYDGFRLYKIGKMTVFNIRYTATISASGTDAAIIPTAYRPAEAYVALGCYSSGSNPFDAQAYATSAGTIRVRIASAVTDIIVSGSWITP